MSQSTTILILFFNFSSFFESSRKKIALEILKIKSLNEKKIDRSISRDISENSKEILCKFCDEKLEKKVLGEHLKRCKHKKAIEKIKFLNKSIENYKINSDINTTEILKINNNIYTLYI